jgi:arylsulfatase A-like enzyme
MNVILITLDSLNTHYLNSYGLDTGLEKPVATPNLDAFAAKATRFTKHFAGSLPCMPARREFLTGTQEFLWRGWGGIEAFDHPLPRIARSVGVVSQLITDHYHYFHHGASGYFEEFTAWDLVRGHEHDAFKTHPKEFTDDELAKVGVLPQDRQLFWMMWRAKYLRNVAHFKQESDWFAPQVFGKASQWLEDNSREHEKFFLYIDSFEVHEPFHVPEPYATMYTTENPTDPSLSYWAQYGHIERGRRPMNQREIQYVRSQYAGKLTMTDKWLGHLMQQLDKSQLWDNTCVIITTDHGHYLGEHGWMGKPNCPVYNEMAQLPLMIWHPQSPHRSSRVDVLTSAVDLYATMLEVLEAPVPTNTHSQSLLPFLSGKTQQHRDWALYGYWGRAVNLTDGRYTYLHTAQTPTAAGNQPLYWYSGMFSDPTQSFRPARTRADAEAGNWLPYSDGPVWRYPLHEAGQTMPLSAFMGDPGQAEHLLFDLVHDPKQQHPIKDQELHNQMQQKLIGALQSLQAPSEQFLRLGLTKRTT